MTYALTKKYTLSLEPGKIFPNNVVSSAQTVRAPHLRVRKCSRTAAYSLATMQRSTSYAGPPFTVPHF